MQSLSAAAIKDRPPMVTFLLFGVLRRIPVFKYFAVNRKGMAVRIKSMRHLGAETWST